MILKIEPAFTPYPKQRDVLRAILISRSKVISVCTGRQVGKSLMASFSAFYWLIKSSNGEIGYITPYYSQGKKVFRTLCRWVNQLNMPKLVEVNKTDMSITFTRKGAAERVNSTRIQFYSAENYDSIRGNTFTHCIIDEAAFIKDEAWREAIKATTLVRCRKLLMVSTPKTKNWFYEEFHIQGESRKSFNFSTWENPYIAREELNQFKKSLPDPVYRQEILGEFVDNGGDVFQNLNLLAITTAPLDSDRYFIGVDVAQTEDFTVVSVMNEHGQILELDRFNSMNYTSIIDRIHNTCSKYPRAKVNVETNSIGAVVLDSLKQKLNKVYVVEGFTTTNSSKDEVISLLIKDVQDLAIKLTPCPNHKELIKEMENFTFRYSPQTKKVIYGARSGFHDDMVMSLAIANKLREDNKSKGVISVY